MMMADAYEIEVAEWEAIATGDQDAFARWFARSGLRLRLSLRSFAALVDAVQVVQDAAIKVWTRAKDITPDGRSGS